MKARWALLAGLVLGLAGLTQAQGRWGMRHQQEDRAERCNLGALSGQSGSLGEALGLTEEQKAQLASLREKNGGQMRQAMQDLRAQVQSGALSREQARAEMEKLRQQRRQELAAILTPEQLQKLDELKAKWPRRGAAPAEEESAPASKAAGQKEESWGAIKSQVR